nr:hypothetical protein [Rhizobium sp. ICMP 5592]
MHLYIEEGTQRQFSVRPFSNQMSAPPYVHDGKPYEEGRYDGDRNKQRRCGTGRGRLQKRLKRDNGKIFVVTHDGMTIPVSRPYAEDARRRFG